MEQSCGLCCCPTTLRMSISANFSSFKKLTTQAFTYLIDSPQQHPSLVAYARYSLPSKYKYERPTFLDLDDEATVASADHEIRPIMHPKRSLVLNAGYAEVINAGKTLQINEDQSQVQTFVVTVPISKRQEGWTENMCQIPCIYFGIFDGHAGYGAALAAYHSLHHHIHANLVEVSHMLILSKEEMAATHLVTGLITSIDPEKLIIGALEKSFIAMDDEIRQQRFDFRIEGGCTALVSLFIQGKVYVASAGDSRAVICVKDLVIPMSEDHNPDSERKRIQNLAYHIPALLCDEYTRFQFQHRCRKKDLGTKQLYRDYTMDGWALKYIDKHDLKPQLISGEGKRSRLLDTIGTTRGFGDHDLEVPYCSSIKIKPFLTAQPEVRVFNLKGEVLLENDCLIMASDGLWEKIENEEAVNILTKTLALQKSNETRRYVVGAQNLVDEARGIFGDRGWRTLSNTSGSYDDICVFVIPLKDTSTHLNNILLADRRKKNPKKAAVEEEFLDIPHSIVSQLDEEREKRDLESISKAYDEIKGIDIKNLDTVKAKIGNEAELMLLDPNNT